MPTTLPRSRSPHNVLHSPSYVRMRVRIRYVTYVCARAHGARVGGAGRPGVRVPGGARGAAIPLQPLILPLQTKSATFRDVTVYVRKFNSVSNTLRVQIAYIRSLEASAVIIREVCGYTPIRVRLTVRIVTIRYLQQFRTALQWLNSRHYACAVVKTRVCFDLSGPDF